MTETNALAELLSAAAERYRAHDSDIARTLAAMLPTLTDRPIVKPATAAPLEGVLKAVFAAGGDPLLKPIAQVEPQLAWWTNGGGKKPVDIAANLSAVEIVGPTGMIETDACRWGLFLQDVNHFYPEHAHAAEELYLVIGGTAEWVRDGKGPAPRPPGSFIHHPSWMQHSMRTRDQRLMAMWAWTGNLDYARYRIVE